jgi:hypothetical protein
MAATQALLNLSDSCFLSEMTLATIAVMNCIIRHWLQKRVAKYLEKRTLIKRF